MSTVELEETLSETVKADRLYALQDGCASVGVLTLNSPKTLNALNLDMVDALYQHLILWEDDDDIACVIIKGEGSKAFCAGGDIQAMYHAMRENPGKACNAAEDFFTREYRLDYTIHRYNKPIIIWGNGIVMGGGLGIFAGGDFRIVTETSRVAMPEITIALYPDVGGSYFLNKMPGHCGRFLGLTGASFNSEDCLFLGLANTFVCQGFYERFVHALRIQNWKTSGGNNSKEHNCHLVEHVLKGLSDKSADARPVGNIEKHLDIINEFFQEPDILRLIDRFLDFDTQDPWLVKAQKTLREGSPLSALIIDKQLGINRKKDLKSVFQSEIILSTNIVRFTEFTEGIRALLIDKDRSPNWHYKNHRDVPSDFVDSFFNAPWPINPLRNL